VGPKMCDSFHSHMNLFTELFCVRRNPQALYITRMIMGGLMTLIYRLFSDAI